MRWQTILPVLISCAVIIAVAIIQKQSRLAAAVTATMPLNVPLALWVVYSAADGDRASVAEFSQGLLLAVFPSLGFLAAVWLAARAGLKLAPMLLIGYGVWGVGIALLMGLRRFVGL